MLPTIYTSRIQSAWSQLHLFIGVFQRGCVQWEKKGFDLKLKMLSSSW